MGRRKNLCLVAEDLGKRKLSDVLKTDQSWDLSAQTIIIAEGLVMCLFPEAVRDLFRQCAAFVGGGSWIAFPISLPVRMVELTLVDGPGCCCTFKSLPESPGNGAYDPKSLGNSWQKQGGAMFRNLREPPINTVWNIM